MSTGFSIDSLKGTPLYALAQNANVNGGGTLDASEMFAFQSQMKNMGWTPEQFGLAIDTNDNNAETAKETRKNMERAGKDLEKSYKAQFGKQGAEAAQTAEQRADAIVKTAYDMFNYEHSGVMFTPQSLGTRPKYTAPEYMDDVARYSGDLMMWANSVKQEYINATKMTNEQLAAIIMQNDNNNARDIMINDNINADQLSNQVAAEGAATRETVRDDGAATRATVRSDGAATRRAVHREGTETRRAVHDEGAITRLHDDINTQGVHEHIYSDGEYTRETVRQEGAKLREHVSTENKQTQELNASSERIQTNLNSNMTTTHTVGTLDTMSAMQEKIIQSDLSHEEKMQLMDKLEKLSIKVIIRDADMKNLDNEINKAITK